MPHSLFRLFRAEHAGSRAADLPAAGRQAGHGARVSLDELLALRFQARGLALPARRRVMSLLAGGYQSGFRGRGMEFVETRHYQPGDDIRAMDWRVTARTGHPHSKVFQEERDRPVFLVVDYSDSMFFGTRVAFKSVIAARAAALLAWAAVGNHDRVGGMVFGETAHHELRPTGGPRGALRLLRLLTVDPRRENPRAFSISENVSALGRGLRRIRRLAHPGSLICLLSDFHGLDQEAERHLQQLAAHSDVLGGFIYDALEAELPPPGRYPVSDGERRLTLNSDDPALRRQYRNHFLDRRAHLEQLFSRHGLRLLSLATHEPVSEVLRNSPEIPRAVINHENHQKHQRGLFP